MKNIKLFKTILFSTIVVMLSANTISCGNKQENNNEKQQDQDQQNPEQQDQEEPTPDQHDLVNYDFFKFIINEGEDTYSLSFDWNNSKYKKDSFNEDIIIPKNHPFDGKLITKIDDGFLQGCTSFNSNVTIPETIESIGAYFMLNCKKFNQPLQLPNSIKYIGEHFLEGCILFNQKIDISNVLTIADNFLSNCIAFNQVFTIPETIKSIGTYFMWNCKNFTNTLIIDCEAKRFKNSEYTLATSDENALFYTKGIIISGKYFHTFDNYFKNSSEYPWRKLIKPTFYDFFKYDLIDNETCVLNIDWGQSQYNKDTFNNEIIIPTYDPINRKPIVKIGDGFLSGCSNFNQKIIFLDLIESIGNSFLKDCSSFNQTISNLELIKNIGDEFLSNCSSYDQPFTLNDDIQTIGNYFLKDCSSFNQSLVIPKKTVSIGDSFMYNNNNFVSALTINCSASKFVYSSYTCATNNNNCKSYIDGIKIAGKYASSFIGRFSNNGDNTPYRKLVLLGS